MNRRATRGVVGVGTVVFVMVIAVAAWATLNRQYIIDQIAVWQYQPSAEIAQIANDAGMNETGKFYYYASHPKLDSTSNFNEDCRRKEQGNAILGCYKAGKIYLYDIDDERLRGVKEVTAAHEMLHAVYERLSVADKRKVNTLLTNEEKKITDDIFRERMEYYRRNQPGQHHNELHSIIGTEVDDIAPELETYYKKYFSDRKKVTALHARYSHKFDELQQGSMSLRQQLEQLSVKINTATRHYNQAIAALNSDIASFNNRAQSGAFSSQGAFASERNALVARTRQLDSRRAAIDADIREYEAKRLAHNQLVDESNSLQQALDSSLAPAPSL